MKWSSGTSSRAGMFRDRADAGRQLGAALAVMPWQDPVVVGLPRGGVPVAALVAEALDAPLDVIIVRKLGLPFSPETAMGAIGEGGVRVLDEALVRRFGVSRQEVADVEARERRTLDERVERLRGGHDRLDLTARTAIIVDDGIATGATARAACLVARHLGAARVVVAAPVGGPDARKRLTDADEVVCLMQPPYFQAVGAHYEVFGQTSDDEVVRILGAHRRPEGPTWTPPTS